MDELVEFLAILKALRQHCREIQVLGHRIKIMCPTMVGKHDWDVIDEHVIGKQYTPIRTLNQMIEHIEKTIEEQREREKEPV